MIARFAVEKERQQSQYVGAGGGGGGGDGSGSDDDSQQPHSYSNPSSGRKTGEKTSSSPKGKKSKKLHGDGGLSIDNSDIHQQSTEEKLADLEHQLQQQQQQMNHQQQYSHHNSAMNSMHQGQGLGQGQSMYMYPNNPSLPAYANANTVTGQLPLPAPLSMPYPSSSSSSSSHNVTGPEAQFMARQKGDFGQNNYWPFQPPLGSPQHLKSIQGPYGSMGLAQGQGPGPGNFDSSKLMDTAAGGAMRDRIVTLEKQVREPT